MEKNIDADKVYRTLRKLILNALVNNYAVERAAFGFDKPGDRVPIDLYAEHLRLNLRQGDLVGEFIDDDGFICEKTRAEFVYELFVSQMERIFDDAPKDIKSKRPDEDIPLLPRFRDYLFGLLPLFTEVMNTDVEYDVFDLIPPNKADVATEYPEWKKFVTAILLKPLRSGSRINRYVKNFTAAPPCIGQIIEKKGNNFYLKPVDIYGGDYAFAMFSLMRFMNAENNKLFELKLLKHKRTHVPRVD